MAKKTKKQKIMAEARRIIERSSKTVEPQEKYPHNKEENQKGYSLPHIESKNHTQNSTGDSKDYKLIKKDLLKTLVLAAVALIVEFLLYLKFKT